MSSELAIQAAVPLAASAVRPPAAIPPPPAAPPALHTNPVPRLDPALGIVVLHLYDPDGVETASIPTRQQLDQYRAHGDVVPKSPLDRV